MASRWNLNWERVRLAQKIIFDWKAPVKITQTKEAPRTVQSRG